MKILLRVDFAERVRSEGPKTSCGVRIWNMNMEPDLSLAGTHDDGSGLQ